MSQSWLQGFTCSKSTTVLIALSFENLQICDRISDANITIMDYIRQKYYPSYPYRVYAFKPSASSSALKRNEVATNLCTELDNL